MSLRSGQLRHPIEIQELTQTPDGVGGFTESPSTIHTPWASIRSATAVEIFNASQLQNVITHVIAIRFIAGLRVDHTILFESREFQIISIMDDQEHEHEQTIQVEERQA